MSRIALLLNGDLHCPERVLPYCRQLDEVWAVDGGWRHAAHLGLKVDYFLGDQDSLTAAERAKLAGDVARDRVFQLPTRKDMTDGVAAWERVLASHPEAEILLLGYNSVDRPDHALGNLFMVLQALRPQQAVLLSDGYSFVRPFVGPVDWPLRARTAAEAAELDAENWSFQDYWDEPGLRFSVLPFTELQGWTWEGTSYLLDRISTPALSGLGISNEPAGRAVRFAVRAGKGLLFACRDLPRA